MRNCSLKTEPNNTVCLTGRRYASGVPYSPAPTTSNCTLLNGRLCLLYILRKEVIQPHLPIRLPCYDFTPIIGPTFGGWLPRVTSPTSGVTNSRGVTGGVYKARERIHRGMLIRDY